MGMNEQIAEGEWDKLFPKVGDLKSVVLMSGPEGSGKTHWAITESPGPHYMIETEGEHNLHTAKEHDSNVRALVLVEALDADRDSRWFAGKGTMWSNFKKAVEALLDAPPGTVIIDSATDLVAMVVGSLTIEWDRGDKAFPTMLYGQVYGEIGTAIAHLRKRHNVILTSRVKEIYRDDKGTGRWKTAIWKQAEYIVEHTIQITVEGDERTFHTRRLKNSAVQLPELKWEWLMSGIPPEVEDSAERARLISRLDKARQALLTENAIVPDKYSQPGAFDSLSAIELAAALQELSALYTAAREAKRTRRSSAS